MRTADSRLLPGMYPCSQLAGAGGDHMYLFVLNRTAHILSIVQKIIMARRRELCRCLGQGGDMSSVGGGDNGQSVYCAGVCVAHRRCGDVGQDS